jgi:hypothetical protein
MVDRASLPAEFFDLTSAHLLVKPVPQFFYNQLLMGALAAELQVPDGLGHPSTEISGVGAPYNNDGGTFKIEDRQIPQSVFAASLNMKGLPGHTVRFNRPLFATTTYTAASRRVGTNTTISTVPITVGSEQNTITLERFAGPYDQANSRVAPYALDKLDASVGVHKMSQIVGTHMKYDYHCFNDAVVGAIVDLGTNLYPKSGYSSINSFTTGSDPLTYAALVYSARVMDDAKLPVLPDGKRLFTLPPIGVECLIMDPMFQRMKAYHADLAAAFPSTYINTVGKFHIFQSNTLSTGTSSGAGTPTVYRGQAIAPGALGVGMGEAPRVAFSNDNNYGETEKVIWVSYMAFAMLDASFVYNVRFTDMSRA